MFDLPGDELDYKAGVEPDGKYTFTEEDKGTKTFRVIGNLAETVRIKAQFVDAPALCAETDDIVIEKQMRKYTTEYQNATVNNYDSLIENHVKCWTDWKIGPPDSTEHYTFKVTNLDPELVKALGYKESSLNPNGPGVRGNLLQLTGGTVNILRGRNLELDWNRSGIPDEKGRYKIETRKVTPDITFGAVYLRYEDVDVNTESGSIKWGIRWLYRKKSRLLIDRTTRPWTAYDPKWLSWPEALQKYGPGNQPSYVPDIMNLYNYGKNPHRGDPVCLWPIRVDGWPRD